jgi:hypothetical protein
MDKKTTNAQVAATGMSFVNGDPFTMSAEGRASVPDGAIEMTWSCPIFRTAFRS